VAEVVTSKITGGGQGSHNKPVGCGASGAYAPCPDDKEEEEEYIMYKACSSESGTEVGTPLFPAVELCSFSGR
jgi:hypothetical protein